MNRTIHKFGVNLGQAVIAHQPNLVPLHFGLDPHGYLSLWGEVDDDSDRLVSVTEWTLIEVYGTGCQIQPIPPGKLRTYIGSVVDGNLVWHAYVVTDEVLS